MSIPRTGPALFLVLAAALTALLAEPADAGPSADATVASDPVFTALKVDGGTVSGRVRQFGPRGELTLVTVAGPEVVLPLEALVRLSRDGQTNPPNPEAPAVLFPDGDRLYRTTIGAATETNLDVHSYALGKLAVPVESVLGLVLALATDSDALDDLLVRVRDEPRSSEVVWLANGDKLTGSWLGLTDKAVEFQPGKAPLKLDRSGVVAIGFDPGQVVYPRPKAGFLELTLSDGSRFGVTGARVEQGHVLAKTRFGSAVKVPLADVSRVHARSSSIVYLSEREAAGAQYVSYVGPTRPYRRDATVEGHPLRLSGQEFERGLGTQSRTLLAYRLVPGDKRFQAEIGLDDRAGPLGNVVFRVRVDTKEVYLSPPLSARDAPRSVDLDLSGAKVLFLITEFGERGGVRDLADWADARIIR